jgi:hypothetical protein
VLAHLTPTQRRALMIADNRIAENAGSTASISVVFQARECAVPTRTSGRG